MDAHADYETTWWTYRQRVSQAEAELAQCLLLHDGTDETITVALDMIYRAAMGTTPAVISGISNVGHPADALCASYLLLFWAGLRSTMASIEGGRVLG